MITTKMSITLAVALLATLLVTAVGVIQFARAGDDAIDRAVKNHEDITFDMNTKTGVTALHDKHGNTVVTDKSGNTLSESNSALASASKADSASAARSDNNVKCFAFCLGISNAKSASAANSESRTNSPGNTATAAPITQNDNTPIQLPPIDKNNALTSFGYDNCIGMSEQGKRSGIRNCEGYTPPRTTTVNPRATTSAAAVATACIDNTGSVQDEGYSFGYYDAQHGKSIASARDHGNHSDEWRQGYRDGWQAGANDLADGVNKNPC
jgi:hypothetical protein